MFESDTAGQGGEVGGGWGDNIMRADLDDRPQLRGGQVQHGDVACADSQEAHEFINHNHNMVNGAGAGIWI